MAGHQSINASLVSLTYSGCLDEEDNVGCDGAQQGDMRNIFRKRRMSCNVVIVGERGVGKTAMVNRFIYDSFSKVSSFLITVIWDSLCSGTNLCCIFSISNKYHAIL